MALEVGDLGRYKELSTLKLREEQALGEEIDSEETTLRKNKYLDTYIDDRLYLRHKEAEADWLSFEDKLLMENYDYNYSEFDEYWEDFD